MPKKKKEPLKGEEGVSVIEKVRERELNSVAQAEAKFASEPEETVSITLTLLESLQKKLEELDEENKTLKKEKEWIEKALTNPADTREELPPIPQKDLGVTTAGVRNTVKGDHFIVICTDCDKEVASLLDNRCETCWQAWLANGGGQKL